MNLKGAILDMDGVIVDTVPIHFKAWKRMFEEYGRKFTFDDYKDKVDGIPRTDGARAILTDLAEAELQKACDSKQDYFLEHLKQGKVPVYQPAIDFVKELITNGLKVAVISSSKNAPYILDNIGLRDKLDAEVNGHDITQGKPDPQIFLMAADRLNLSYDTCVVFEDAVLGVEAAKRAGMFCVGVDRHNDPDRLKQADMLIKDFTEINLDKLREAAEK